MTDRHHEKWTDQLSDYLADELDPAARHRLEEHLAGCIRCRDVLDGLRHVVAVAGEAAELQPRRDLWPQIRAGLGGAPGIAPDQDIIELPTTFRRPIEIALSGARLGVAAAALVLVTAGTTWWVASGSSLGGEGGPAAAGAVTTVAGEPGIPQDLAAQLGMLEDVLESARTTLDPETVATLERNLQTIETAITDSRQALQTDPGNAFLLEHLERMYRRKLVYLQDAVRVAEWAG